MAEQSYLLEYLSQVEKIAIDDNTDISAFYRHNQPTNEDAIKRKDVLDRTEHRVKQLISLKEHANSKQKDVDNQRRRTKDIQLQIAFSSEINTLKIIISKIEHMISYMKDFLKNNGRG
ncbi:MAG: hypothetical protein PHW96_00895 [Candidatus Nanoarchaeia archaeon]|nr:hypothetical protein [Candidatus Nanoarchaeia archaeon]